MRLGAALAVAAAALSTAAWQRPHAGPFGFTRASAAGQADVERRFLAMPSADQIRDAHLFLADQPHMAGTARDRELAEWTRDRFRAAGLEDVAITTHDVLLPWPEEVSVEMIAPRPGARRCARTPVPGDQYTHGEHADPGVPFHAYSASGDVSAPVVFAGNGLPADYDWLTSEGIDVRGKIVARPLLGALQLSRFQGADGRAARRRRHSSSTPIPPTTVTAKGKVYPDGPWGPDTHIQRGGIAYDFLVPGDPLTPGWASTAGAPRVAAGDALSLPKIVSAPLSYDDARVILESLGGPEVPRGWRGAGAFTWRAGPGQPSCGFACGPTIASVPSGPSPGSFAAASGQTTW